VADGRKRRAGSEPPPCLAPSIRSGLVSGDGIVAAGRKKVFNRVAETRALAAQASRARASRVRVLPAETCGSTTSGGSPPARHSRALIVVRLIHILINIFRFLNYLLGSIYACCDTKIFCWFRFVSPEFSIQVKKKNFYFRFLFKDKLSLEKIVTG
jgi:hypothetical protein